MLEDSINLFYISSMSKLDYGYNIPALKGMMLEEIQTPCLLSDYETFKLNVEKMRSFTHENNIKLRPHAKMHKSVELSLIHI